jgi:hypothetical protein
MERVAPFFHFPIFAHELPLPLEDNFRRKGVSLNSVRREKIHRLKMINYYHVNSGKHYRESVLPDYSGSM